MRLDYINSYYDARACFQSEKNLTLEQLRALRAKVTVLSFTDDLEKENYEDLVEDIDIRAENYIEHRREQIDKASRLKSHSRLLKIDIDSVPRGFITRHVEKEMYKIVFNKHQGNMWQMAKDLGVSNHTVKNKIKKFDLKVDPIC